MQRNYLIVLLIVAFIGLGLFEYQSLKHQPPTQTNHSITKPRVLPKEVTITLDKNSFSPAVVTIKVGSAVRWKNVSGDKQTVNSDDYPTNQLHKELNFGVFNSGSTVVYTFTKPATYGYHNQFHPDDYHADYHCDYHAPGAIGLHLSHVQRTYA
jgi:plastocyanin